MINKRVRTPVLLALFTSVMCITSFIAIPLFGIPITLQSFGVAMALFMLGGARATASVAVYIVIGVIGLPVFSGFGGGLGVLLGPTGGFIFGFLAMALVYCLITAIFGTSQLIKIVGCIMGHLLMYAIGSVWYLVFYGGGAGYFDILLVTVLPFVIPDAVKAALAYFVSKRLSKFIRL